MPHNCPRCGRKRLESHGEPWCLACGSVAEPLTELEIAAAQRDWERPSAGGLVTRNEAGGGRRRRKDRLR